ncbi:hypothetical protein OAB61_00330 [bacterium]|jgi:hypothetical protein|nr:hypothetical protein [bacterium]
MENKEAPLTNEFVTSKMFEKTVKKQSVQSTIIADSTVSELFGVKVGEKITFKKWYWPNFTLGFEGGGTVKMKPAEMIIFSDGTFKFTRYYDSTMYTKFQRPRYNAKMFIRVNFNNSGTILDSYSQRWSISCGSKRYIINGTFDPKYFDIMNDAVIEYSGSAYNC